MKRRQKIAHLSFSCVMAAAITAGTAGTARASIVNDPGTVHWQNGGDDHQCLLADLDTGKVEQWRCLNTVNEEWTSIPVAIYPGGPTDYTLLNAHNGSYCMAVPNYPSNGTQVVLALCDAEDVRQFWRVEGGDGGSDPRRFRSLQGNLCLDKPAGNTTWGTPVQTWQCGSSGVQRWSPL